MAIEAHVLEGCGMESDSNGVSTPATVAAFDKKVDEVGAGFAAVLYKFWLGQLDQSSSG